VPVGGGGGEGAGLDVDGGFVEILSQRLGCRRAEDLQRRAFRRVDRDPHVVDAHPVRVPGGHQGELVGRQRPVDTGRNHECHVLGVALLDIAQEAAVDLVVAVRSPRQGPGERGFASGADGDHQGVVRQLLAGAHDRGARPVVHSDQRAVDEAGSQIVGDRVEPVALRTPAGERLGDRHRPIDELLFRSQQRSLDPLAGQVAQREQGLQTGDATAGDQDPKRAGRRASHDHTALGTAARSQTGTTRAADRRETSASSGTAPSRGTATEIGCCDAMRMASAPSGALWRGPLRSTRLTPAGCWSRELRPPRGCGEADPHRTPRRRALGRRSVAGARF
jgi:hypothetical protein